MIQKKKIMTKEWKLKNKYNLKKIKRWRFWTDTINKLTFLIFGFYKKIIKLNILKKIEVIGDIICLLLFFYKNY